jgi:predicted ribosome quality control (RQC) complex YloA/Tae2 family protein
MAMTGLALHFMREELNPLIGARIDKIQQPDRDSLVISFFQATSKFHGRLLININHENGRLQLTKNSFENPASPPPFCMALRKHLLGARLFEISQDGLDRVLRFSLCGKNELEDELRFSLVVELTGRHGNILLLLDDKIIDCLRHIGIGDNITRPALPGLKYTPLPEREHKISPFELDESTIEKNPGRELYKYVEGLDAKSCAALPEDSHGIIALLKSLERGERKFCLHPRFGVLPFLCAGGETISSLSEGYDIFFAEKDLKLRMSRQSSSLNSVLQNAHKRAARKLEQCLANLQNSEQAEELRKFGELLSFSQKEALRGNKQIKVLDYYREEPIEISIDIDPSKSIRENANAYFKKYKKAKSAREYAIQALPKLREELEYLDGLILQLSFCSAAVDIADLRSELRQQGYIKEDVLKRGIKSKPVSSRPPVFFAEDGTKIEVGKNNLQNDMLTKNARPGEWWMHAKDMPGSHVIIHCENPSEATLLFAARLAAKFSAGRASGRVTIDCTQKRFVKKPPGSKPGFVIYTNQTSYFVKPGEN